MSSYNEVHRDQGKGNEEHNNTHMRHGGDSYFLKDTASGLIAIIRLAVVTYVADYDTLALRVNLHLEVTPGSVRRRVREAPARPGAHLLARLQPGACKRFDINCVGTSFLVGNSRPGDYVHRMIGTRVLHTNPEGS